MNICHKYFLLFIALIIGLSGLCSMQSTACPPPPTQPPNLSPSPGDPCHASGGQNKNPNDPNTKGGDPNTKSKVTPTEKKPEGVDPVYLDSGSFAYSVTDLVIKGRKLDVVIQRSYLNDYTTYGTANFIGGGSDPDGYIARYQWLFPQEAYDILRADTNTPSCKFTVPGTYHCSYRVQDNDGAWSNFVDFNTPIDSDAKSGRFGYNWDMNYNLKVIEVNTTSIIFYDGQNHRVAYNKISGSKYTGPAHISDYFLKENGDFTLYKKHGMKYKFDSDRCLSKIEDRFGNSINFSYTGSGLYKKLTTITDDLNRNITLTYNDDGLLWKITDFAGRTWTYNYDSATNNLLSKITPGTDDDILSDNNSLVSYWKFDEQEGNAASDSKGINNGTLINEPVRTSGLTNRALSFDGIDDYVEISDTNDASLEFSQNSSFTISCWVKAPLSVSGGYVLSKMRTGAQAGIFGYEITYGPLDGRFCFITESSCRGNVETLTPVNSAPGGQWNHIVCVYDNKAIRVYVNGQLQATNTFSYDTGTSVPDKAMAIGARSYDTIVTGNFKGLIDDVQIYNRALTNDELDGLNLKAEYTYDSRHNLLTIKDPNGQTWLINNYDSLDRVVTQTSGDANYVLDYDPNNGKTAVTDRKGNIRTTYYNSIGNTVRTVDSNDAGLEDPCSFITQYEYDPSTEKVRKTILPKGNSIAYEFDSRGNILRVISEPNNGDANITTSYTYDPNFDFIETQTDPKGNVTYYDYDEKGSLLSITYPTVSTPGGNRTPVISFTYNSFGQVETITAPDGIVTEYLYYSDDDANDPNCGRLWKTIVDANETEGLKITTEYRYDIQGNVIEIKDPNNDLTKFAYNQLDLLTRVTSPLNYVTNLSYNKNKKLAQIEKARTGEPNQLTRYTYSKMDKLQTAIDPLSNITRYGYDASDNLSDVNDAENNITHYEYDKRNMPARTIDANGGATAYSYTPNGRLAKIRDANGNETLYAYDGFDRLVRVTYPDDTNEIYSYDKNSNVTNFKNRADQTITYQYDALDRPIEENWPNSQRIIKCRYDIAGRIFDINDNGSLTKYGYDRIGRVNEVNDIEKRLVKYEYDKLGRRTKLTYPDNTEVTYEYDAGSRLAKVKYQNDTIAQYTYDDLGRRTLLTYGNNTTIAYLYDIGDRLTRITNNTNPAIDIYYTQYDNVGNRKNMIISSNESKYTYDKLYQLKFVDYPTGQGTDANFCYDSLGNRTQVVAGSTTNYAHNKLNQYDSVGGTSYTYDTKGNLTSDGTYTYIYDCKNHLIEVKQGQAAIAQYAYDFTGRRASKTASGVITKYCYDGGQIIAEYDNTGTLLKKYIYGPAIDEPIMMVVVNGSETRYYYHFDGLGSVVALSNLDGTIAEQYSYDVFGTPNAASSLGNRFMFTGREYDSETGNYYYRARYYKPSIGRFLQTDPIRYSDGLNLYTYVGNNPLNWIDPWGLEKGGWDKGWEDFKAWLKAMMSKLTPGGWTGGAGETILKGGTAVKAYQTARDRAIENPDTIDDANYNKLKEIGMTPGREVRKK